MGSDDRGGRRLVARLLGAAVLALALPAPAAEMSRAERDARFERAMEELRHGDLEAAIAAFRGILDAFPGLDRVRMELALAYYRTLRFAEAEAIARDVLADPATPASVQRKIRAFLDAVGRSRRAHGFRPSVEIGYVHDDNVNVGPSRDVIDIGGGRQVVLAPASRPRSDNAVVASATLSHRYRLPVPSEIGGRGAGVLWLSGLGAFAREHLEASDSDLEVFTASTGPAVLVPRRWRARLIAQGDYVRLGGVHLASILSLNPALTVVAGAGELTWESRIEHRDFRRARDAGRDADVLSTGLRYGHALLEGRLGVEVGARWLDEDADVARFDNDGWEVFGGLVLRARRDVSLYARVSSRSREFGGPEPVFGVARDEEETIVAAGLRYTVSARGQPWLDGLRLHAFWRRTDNDSNVPVFDFDRHQMGLSLQRSF